MTKWRKVTGNGITIVIGHIETIPNTGLDLFFSIVLIKEKFVSGV